MVQDDGPGGLDGRVGFCEGGEDGAVEGCPFCAELREAMGCVRAHRMYFYGRRKGKEVDAGEDLDGQSHMSYAGM